MKKIISGLLGFLPLAFAANQGLNKSVNETIANVTSNVTSNISSNISSNVTAVAGKAYTGFPALDIFLIACVITLVTSLITKKTTPQDEMKRLKKDLKEMNKKIKEHTKNQEMDKVKKLQQEVMKINGELMKKNMNLKNMLITSVPILLVLNWVRAHYQGYGEFLDLGITMFGWLGVYIWSSIIWGLLWRKLLKMA